MSWTFVTVLAVLGIGGGFVIARWPSVGAAVGGFLSALLGNL